MILSKSPSSLLTKEWPWAICSGHYKRATMSKLLSSLCKKGRHEWFAHDSKKVTFNWIELNWMIWANRSQKGVINLKKIKFIVCIWLFSPYLCPRESCTCHSSLSLKKKSNGKDLLLSLLTKEYRERITPITLYKRAAMSDSFPSLMICSFHKQFALKTNEQIPNPVNCTLLWNMEGFF